MITIAGKNKSVNKNIPGISLKEIGEKIGDELNGIIGTDLLKETTVLLDYQNKRCLFSYKIPNNINGLSRTDIDVTLSAGIPIITISVDRNDLRAILDTSADISYILETNSYEQFRTNEVYQDFHPVVGNFDTPIYEIPVNIGNDTEFICKFGTFVDVDAGSHNQIKELSSQLGGRQ